jgi:vancomycin permeability regulator SanA
MNGLDRFLLPSKPAARGVAAALGLFAVGNAVAGWWLAGTLFDQNIWWIDSRPLPTWLANPLIMAAGILMVVYAWYPKMIGLRRPLTRGAMAALALVSVWNTVAYWGLMAMGTIDSPFPLPLSSFVALLLIWLWRVTASNTPVDGIPHNQWRQWLVTVLAFLLLPVLFPLAQMFFYGKTDYRRTADAAVVFGAAVWPGNRPSHALTDRVMTGVRLYQDGVVKKLLFSGGPSASPEIVHEVVAMRKLALDAGVPDGDIILDPEGINSRATVVNTARLAHHHQWQQLLAVSHFYHLPRIKMTFARAGLTVFTVPAKEEHILVKLPFYLGREVAALWYYYLRPLWE